jgi:hypothetical protein
MSFLRFHACFVASGRGGGEAGATGNGILACDTTPSFHFLSKSIIIPPAKIAKLSPNPEAVA